MTLNRILAIVALVAGASAAVLGGSRSPQLVAPLELAEWIRDRKAGLVVLDTRPDSEYQQFHVPSAEHLSLDSLAQRAVNASETLVIYANDGVSGRMPRTEAHVVVLEGGLLRWMNDVVNPVVPDHTGDAARDSASDHIADLSRYFGGVPRAARIASPGSARSANSAVTQARRRGC